jgi:hypothetical protein
MGGRVYDGKRRSSTPSHLLPLDGGQAAWFWDPLPILNLTDDLQQEWMKALKAVQGRPIDYPDK